MRNSIIALFLLVLLECALAFSPVRASSTYPAQLTGQFQSWVTSVGTNQACQACHTVPGPVGPDDVPELLGGTLTKFGELYSTSPFPGTIVDPDFDTDTDGISNVEEIRAYLNGWLTTAIESSPGIRAARLPQPADFPISNLDPANTTRIGPLRFNVAANVLVGIPNLRIVDPGEVKVIADPAQFTVSKFQDPNTKEIYLDVTVLTATPASFQYALGASGYFCIPSMPCNLPIGSGRNYSTTVGNISMPGAKADGPVAQVMDIDLLGNGQIPAGVGGGVAENATAGTYVGIEAKAVDPDPADTITYQLSELLPQKSRFEFEAGTTRVVVAKGAEFDARSEPNIKVRITASSTGPLGTTTSSGDFTIIVRSDLGAGAIAGAVIDPELMSVASTLDDVCATLHDQPIASDSEDQKELFQACRALTADALNGADVDVALRAIRNEEALAATDTAIRVGRIVGGNISTRLDQLRSGGRQRSVSVANLRLTAAGEGGEVLAMAPRFVENVVNSSGLFGGEGAAGHDWGFWVNGGVTFGSKDPTSPDGGFDFDIGGLTVGADYLLSPAFVAGVAITFTDTSASFLSSDSKLDANGVTYTAYGSYKFNDRTFIDGHLGFSSLNFTSAREISFSANNTPFSRVADAEYDASEMIAGLRGIYVLANSQSTALEAIVGLLYVRTAIDAYEEDHGGGFNLFVDKQKESALTVSAGARARTSFEWRDLRIEPSTEFNFNLENGRDDRSFSAGFLADPLRRNSILVRSIGEDDNIYFDAGAGLTAYRENGSSFFVNYSTLLGLRQTTAHEVRAGVAVPF